MIMSIIEWLAPFLLVPASYFSYRFVGFRKPRYWIYFILLLSVFYLEIVKISFQNDLFDFFQYLLVPQTISLYPRENKPTFRACSRGHRPFPGRAFGAAVSHPSALGGSA